MKSIQICLVLSLALVFTSVLASDSVKASESPFCKCDSWTLGKFCHNSPYLTGPCENNFLYRCDGYGLEALKSARCTNCLIGSDEGRDNCPGGRHFFGKKN